MTFPPVFVVITLRGGVAEGLGEDVGVGCFGLAGTLQVLFLSCQNVEK